MNISLSIEFVLINSGFNNIAKKGMIEATPTVSRIDISNIIINNKPTDLRSEEPSR
jgi:hypothetical protein